MSTAEKIADVAGALVDSRIEFRRERCTRLRHRTSSCDLCVAACTVSSILLEDDRPRVDSVSCTRCGGCVAVCPTGAFEAFGPTDEALADDIASTLELTQDIVFACSKVTTSAALPVHVECLARLDATWMASALAKGASSVTLTCADCHECACAGAGLLAQEAAVQAQELSAALGLPGKISFMRADTPSDGSLAEPTGAAATEAGLSRRGFLRVLARGGASATSKVVGALVASPIAEQTDVEVLRGFPVHLPSRRVRVFECLAAGTAHASDALRELLLTPAISEQGCSACSMCARLCPTGALKARRADKEYSIALEPASCVSCALCVEVCPRNAVSLAAPASTAELRRGSVQTLVTKSGCVDPLKASCEDKMSRLLGIRVTSA